MSQRKIKNMAILGQSPAPGGNGLDTLNGLFKHTYSDKIINLIPEGMKLMANIKFLPKEKQTGLAYNQP